MGLHDFRRSFHHLVAPTKTEDGSDIIGEDDGGVGIIVSLTLWLVMNTAEFSGSLLFLSPGGSKSYLVKHANQILTNPRGKP